MAMLSLSSELIARANSFPGITAGISSLDDVLTTPSHKLLQREAPNSRLLDSEASVPVWPPDAKTVLVLGLHHPQDNPRLDWWLAGNSMGNRQLMKVCESLKQWLESKHGLSALHLPYYVEHGGLFLKDAAVKAGLGIIGKNNLLLNPQWGPRIRLRALLIEAELEATAPATEFTPCETCNTTCQSVCPKNAFSTGNYQRSRCMEQMAADRAHSMISSEASAGNLAGPIVFCRACEFACPVGV